MGGKGAGEMGRCGVVIKPRVAHPWVTLVENILGFGGEETSDQVAIITGFAAGHCVGSPRPRVVWCVRTPSDGRGVTHEETTGIRACLSAFSHVYSGRCLVDAGLPPGRHRSARG